MNKGSNIKYSLDEKAQNFVNDFAADDILADVKKKLQDLKDKKNKAQDMLFGQNNVAKNDNDTDDDSDESNNSGDDNESYKEDNQNNNGADDDDIDDDLEDDYDNQKNLYYGKKEYKYKTSESIPTEGLKADEIQPHLFAVQPGIKYDMCESCGKYFGEQILVANGDMRICMHCFFLMNFGNENVINGQVGPNVVEYILLCHDQHKYPCARLSDLGGCYLCLHKSGVPIDGAEALLGGFGEYNDVQDFNDCDSQCSIDDVCTDAVVGGEDTVYI